MPYLVSRRIRGVLLTCVAALAVAAPAAEARLDQPPARSDASAAISPGSPTTNADIDAVPGLREQLIRHAEIASDGTRPRGTRALRGTTDADIDAVPGLREQLIRHAEAAAADADEATVAFQWEDAAIGAAGAAGLLAAIAASVMVASAARRRDGQTPRVG